MAFKSRYVYQILITLWNMDGCLPCSHFILQTLTQLENSFDSVIAVKTSQAHGMDPWMSWSSEAWRPLEQLCFLKDLSRGTLVEVVCRALGPQPTWSASAGLRLSRGSNQKQFPVCIWNFWCTSGLFSQALWGLQRPMELAQTRCNLRRLPEMLSTSTLSNTLQPRRTRFGNHISPHPVSLHFYLDHYYFFSISRKWKVDLIWPRVIAWRILVECYWISVWGLVNTPLHVQSILPWKSGDTHTLCSTEKGRRPTL